MVKYYLNLTNGIEAFEHMSECLFNCGYIRIQSTMCEQKNWNRIIQELDYDFLLNLAIGNRCIVVDYGANKPIPRALYQGVEFIRYTLNRRWFNIDTNVVIKRSVTSHGNNSTNYFQSEYNRLDDRTKKKLDYFKTFLNKENILNLDIISDSTNNDGNKEYYKDILYNYGV